MTTGPTNQLYTSSMPRSVMSCCSAGTSFARPSPRIPVPIAGPPIDKFRLETVTPELAVDRRRWRMTKRAASVFLLARCRGAGSKAWPGPNFHRSPGNWETGVGLGDMGGMMSASTFAVVARDHCIHSTVCICKACLSLHHASCRPRRVVARRLPMPDCSQPAMALVQCS